MSFVAISIAGVLVGFIAGFIMRQKISGIIGYMLVGLVGSFIGGFFFWDRLTITSSEFVNVLIASTIGAVIFLAVAIGLFIRTETRNETA